VFALGLVANVTPVVGQQKQWVQRNNPNYDNKKLTYGFLLALHSSTYNTTYYNAFVTQQCYTVNP
jgi:hypothetical protein